MNWSLEKFAGIFDKCRTRKRAYCLSLKSVAGQEVLLDLASFCRANETCIALDQQQRIDERRTFVLEGRREVYLRIMEHLDLTPDQLATLYSGHTFIADEETD